MKEQLDWQSVPEGKHAKAKKASKTKFTCPECGQSAWAKPDALLICGVCYEDSADEICLMLAEPSRESLPRPRSSFDEIKADEYREWQALPGYERLNAIVELSLAGYQLKEPTRDVQSRLQRTLVRVQRAPR